MSKSEIPKAYEPQKVEDDIYTAWEQSGLFNPDNLPGKRTETFSIVLPPPNVTGTLHIGHAVMLAIEDAMIRFARMQGKKTLWLPGTDHAAIATQSKVEKILYDTEGKSRHDLGREEFLKRVDQYAQESHDVIINQTKKMGSSLDWSREAFTLDEPRNKAVRTIFKKMYDDGLIYRGHRIVNWDPKMQSNVSDDEIERREEKAPFYYFQYGPFEIGTARPETKFGDKYVVMHPDDDRYKDYKHGDTFECEWINGKIMATVIKDEAVDPEFGSGVMTITPWHDVTDFEIAERHNLDKQQIINLDGKLLAIAGEFARMDIEEARPKIVAKLKEKGLLVRTDDDYVHNVATNYRGGGIIEPQIREQWFVDVNKEVPGRGKSLKEMMLEVVRNKDIEIIPERFEKTYFHWIENLRDWNISRQLWYGHRIPVWYKGNETYVGIDAPEGEEWEQDSDTLDTWFSAGIWTFSTLGWPEETEDLKTYHPTTMLETGYDILFFWVARMILMTTYALGEIPFKYVYLHGLIRDDQGRKMSKSLDNIIDPLDTIAEYGADATRLSLMIGTSPGQDQKLSMEKIGQYRNFTNKLWNISRFVLTSVDEIQSVQHVQAETLSDKWILSRFEEVREKVTMHMEKFEFSAAGEALRDFTWGEFADWYLEIAKVQKKQGITNTDSVLLYILERLLTMWHPFMPFVTEEIWKQFNASEMMIIHEWPSEGVKTDENTLKSFSELQETIVAIRNLRSEYKVEPGKFVTVALVGSKFGSNEIEVLKTLARVEDILDQKPAEAATAVVGKIEVHLSLEGLVDKKQEKKRLKKELDEVTKYLSGVSAKLANKEFLSKAPEKVVADMEQKRDEAVEKQSTIQQQIDQL